MTTPAYPLPDQTWLVMPTGGIGRIIRHRTHHRAPGYDINDGSTYTRFMPDWCAHPAIIGDTVCPQPYGTHHCGLTHLPANELAWLPTKEETSC